MITYNVHAGLSAWSARNFNLRDRCSTGGNAYECITPGNSTVAPNGTWQDIANGGAAHFRFLSAINFTTPQACSDQLMSQFGGGQNDNATVYFWNDSLYNFLSSEGSFFRYYGVNSNGFSTLFSAAPGDSFRDKGGPLLYNAANGTAFDTGGGSGGGHLWFYLNVANVTFAGLQFKASSAPNGDDLMFVCGGNIDNFVIDGCIIDSTCNMIYFGNRSGGSIRNSFVSYKGPNPGGDSWPINWDTGATNGSCVNCTLIATVPMDTILAGAGNFANQVVVRNTAIFGCSAPLLSINMNSCLVADHCITDAPNFNFGWGNGNAGGNIFSSSQGANFFSTSDFRLKGSSPMIGTGVVDTTHIPTGQDIYHNSRGSSWDMGAAESAPPLATATFAGIGQVIARGALVLPGRATINATGSVTANATVVSTPLKQASALIAGIGTVFANTTMKAQGTATLPGVGSVTALPTITDTQARAIIHGVGTVQLLGLQTFPIDPTTIHGVGGVTVSRTTVVVVALDVLQGPPAADPIDKYLDLVPSYNAIQPKFMTTLAVSLRPLVEVQTFLQGLPEQFDLDTAVGMQLDTDGIWIGRSRFVNTPITGVYFSWDTDGLGWEEGTWQGAFDPDEGLTALDDETYRQLLYAKVGANHWDGTSDGIVAILTTLLENQGVSAHVVDNQDMSMTVSAIGNLSNVVFRALLLGGYIPIKPVGVSINYVLDTVLGGQETAATISGVGNVIANTIVKAMGTALIQGFGSVTANAIVPGHSGSSTGSATIHGVGNIIANTVVRNVARATITGVGSVTANATTATTYTNYVRNPRAEGGVVGTPGTVPTDWALNDNDGTNLALAIVSIGTDGGIPYIDLRITGTPSNAGGIEMFVSQGVTGGTTGVTAGSHWTFSAWLKLQAGNFNGAKVTLKVEETNVDTYLTEDDLDVVPTTAALNTQQLSNNNFVLSGSGVNTLKPIIQVYADGSSAVSLTLRIGAPMLLRSATAPNIAILPPVGAIPPQGSGTTVTVQNQE